MLTPMMLASLTTRKVLNEKILYYSILESSRGKLQKCVIKNEKFHLKNSNPVLTTPPKSR